jgi:ferredoxin-NADP reductase
LGQIVKIKSIEHLTHDVLQVQLEKPEGVAYVTGQAADISINKPGWEEELRAFTFTSQPEDDYLEFIIKTYPTHEGVTNELLSLKAGDEMIVGDVFGDISYKGDGVFIAGGAGVTPFIAILDKLEKEGKLGDNRLLFANTTKSDSIREQALTKQLGKNFVNILSNEQVDGYEHGFINTELINKYSADNLKYYYLCGPDPMMEAVEKQLESLGVAKEYIVREAF